MKYTIGRYRKNTCLCCLRKFSSYLPPSPHHLLPRSQGGTDDERNIVFLCRNCHDMLEIAQEAQVLGLNRPLRPNQLYGIFAKNDDSTQKDGELNSDMITPITKKLHANRLINQTPIHRLNLLAAMANAQGYWHHVDWGMVEGYLNSQKQATASLAGLMSPGPVGG